MILDILGVRYEIIEASNRHGGRAYTHHFNAPKIPNFHNYYDVGAMRFPRTKFMDSVFELFRVLGLEEDGKIIEYIMNAPGNRRLFNGQCSKSSCQYEYLTFTYTRPNGMVLVGVEALLADAYDPFKEKLIEDFEEGWEYLMGFDNYSARTYLGQVKGHPFSVITWMETMDTSTLSYDLAFTETIIDSLDFDYPFGPNDPPDATVEWACVDGGTSVVTDRMAEMIRTKPHYNLRVTAIAMDNPASDNPNMKISVQDHPEWERERYSHVICTAPLPCMRVMDLEQAGLDYVQKQALRCLGYGASIKVGIKFETRWWEKASHPFILGGTSSTDRPSRVVVYPSYGFDDPQDANGVLIASYCWTQDALRLGSLIKGKGTDEENLLLDIIYKDLAEIHGEDPQWYKDQTVDYHAYDWYHDQYTMGGKDSIAFHRDRILTAVAFALFGPGQFSNMYPELTKPAAKGNLHFVGEATSTHHAWIVGALESAHRGIYEILFKEQRTDLIKNHAENWKQGEVKQGRQAEGQWGGGIFGV
ncbi:unnamed protein product [Tuber melanosporum]|uniref:(Perigord truffle) hypothetical protein n=1 Tax=Tuber melanosporum (strain Mel28) TaxID=656061 RepID=D5GG97_TUBMM|nr:uncharacterized protein GSTUM_00007281001 [Tuber melanosporum]CAZ83540.1 unnamed protein product [Tuber melanosporum]